MKKLNLQFQHTLGGTVYGPGAVEVSDDAAPALENMDRVHAETQPLREAKIRADKPAAPQERAIMAQAEDQPADDNQ
jgi:hypothetical protein